MKLRKVLALCLASAMTFSLAACGGAAETAPAAPAQAEAEAETSDATETEEVAADAVEAPTAESAESGLAFEMALLNLHSSIKGIMTTTWMAKNASIIKNVSNMDFTGLGPPSLYCLGIYRSSCTDGICPSGPYPVFIFCVSFINLKTPKKLKRFTALLRQLLLFLPVRAPWY